MASLLDDDRERGIVASIVVSAHPGVESDSDKKITRALILGNLANAILTRSEQQGQSEDLDASIGYYREALDLSPKVLSRLFNDPPLGLLKSAAYPNPGSSSASEDTNFQGVGPHKDASFLTYLLQGKFFALSALVRQSWHLATTRLPGRENAVQLLRATTERGYP